MTMRLSCTVSEIYSLKDIGVTTSTFFGSRDVIGHVTIKLRMCGILLVVHCNHASILHRYGNMESHTFWGHDVDLLGPRDVIGQVTIKPRMCGFP